MRLVADIGGTNSRLALAAGGTVLSDTLRSYANDSYTSFEDVVNAYLRDVTTDGLAELVIAVAGPVNGIAARLTNRDWHFNEDELADHLNIENVRLINDLTALGYAAPALQISQKTTVIDGDIAETHLRQSLVVGIGTGFNVSPVLQHGASTVCAVSETGHISMGSGVTAELERLRPGLSQGFPTVEHLFSGRGYTAFCAGVTGGEKRHPADIIKLVQTKQDDALVEATDSYAGLIGHLIRDLLLAFMPNAGIYFAGSVAREVLSLPAKAQFEAVLGEPFHIDVALSCPIWAITDDGAALIGCANMTIDPDPIDQA